jgi:hypothetical protein
MEGQGNRLAVGTGIAVPGRRLPGGPDIRARRCAEPVDVIAHHLVPGAGA